MSHIPNSAIPHAGPSQDTQQDQQGGSGLGLAELPGKLGDLVRENPKTAAAAGAAVIAGVAAAAIPLVRGRKSGGGGKKKG